MCTKSNIAFCAAEPARALASRNRKLVALRRALDLMRAGATLYLTYCDGQPLWCLSDGVRVSAETATRIINHASIVPADRALFDTSPAQTGEISE